MLPRMKMEEYIEFSSICRKITVAENIVLGSLHVTVKFDLFILIEFYTSPIVIF